MKRLSPQLIRPTRSMSRPARKTERKRDARKRCNENPSVERIESNRECAACALVQTFQHFISEQLYGSLHRSFYFTSEITVDPDVIAAHTRRPPDVLARQDNPGPPSAAKISSKRTIHCTSIRYPLFPRSPASQPRIIESCAAPSRVLFRQKGP